MGSSLGYPQPLVVAIYVALKYPPNNQYVSYGRPRPQGT